MKPLIGISPSTELDQTYFKTGAANVQAIEQAGGTPVILPLTSSKDTAHELAKRIDGLFLTGGYDIDPTLFNEEPHPKLGTITPLRDEFELNLIQNMRTLHKPILGVCRGSQMMNVAIGGDMYQDIYSQVDRKLLQHQQKAPNEHGSHFVQVEKDSLLYKLTGQSQLRVNSRHHQANRVIPQPYQVSGTASDGVIEAFESQEAPFFLGVQWHPESMVASGDEASKKIFSGFVQACKVN